jgi:hypothetical protein
MQQTKKLIELKQGDKSAFLLNINDVTCGCPFKTPIPKPNAMTGQVQMDAQPCMSNCPLFKIIESANGDAFMVSIGCGGMPVEHEIDEVAYAEKLESKTLIV